MQYDRLRRSPMTLSKYALRRLERLSLSLLSATAHLGLSFERDSKLEDVQFGIRVGDIRGRGLRPQGRRQAFGLWCGRLWRGYTCVVIF